MQLKDKIQFLYKKEKNPVFEVIQGLFIGQKDGWLFLEDGRKFNINKIKGGVRNISNEMKPPEIEDE